MLLTSRIHYLFSHQINLKSIATIKANCLAQFGTQSQLTLLPDLLKTIPHPVNLTSIPNKMALLSNIFKSSKSQSKDYSSDSKSYSSSSRTSMSSNYSNLKPSTQQIEAAEKKAPKKIPEADWSSLGANWGPMMGGR